MSIGVRDIASPISAASVRVASKLNLTLDVVRRRDDGYHDLCSLVVGVDLCDRVRGIRSESAGVAVACADRRLVGEQNLAAVAARTFAERTGITAGLAIEIEKHIPVGGGLGGGSSDAAGTLRLCDTLWATELSHEALAELGSRVGADVPLFFYLPSAVMRGRGDRVEPIPLRWSGWVVLVLVGEAVPTSEVYRAWRPGDRRGMPDADVQELAQAASAKELSAGLRNHLEPAVFRIRPGVARAHEMLVGLGFGGVRVSGAGSTLYLLFDDNGAAEEAAATMRREGGLETVVVAAPIGESSIETEEH